MAVWEGERVSEHLWYASYGSNLFEARFAYYLRGGRPPGATRTYPGARTRTPPAASRGLRVPGQVFFGWESATWGGGGVAFLDPEAAGEALVRAYRITPEQFADVVAQEMHREPGADIDLSVLHAERRMTLGPGRYETLVLIDHLEGEPVLTFTCSASDERPELNPPSERYLQMIAAGLRESHGLQPEEVVDYLSPLPGVHPAWSRADLSRVVGVSPRRSG